MIKLKNVSKMFASKEIVTTALNGINLVVEAGEYVAITGQSGSGKSTLLSIVGMLCATDAGEYWFEGRNVAGESESRLSKWRRGKIGFIFQQFNLIEELAVAENVELALDYSGVPTKQRKDRVAAILDELGVVHRAKHRPSQLSGGQQQRVAIARALVNEPAVLLADEPTGNLDSTHGEDVMRCFERIHQRGTTIVMVTHSTLNASRASRTIALLDGTIVSDATVSAR